MSDTPTPSRDPKGIDVRALTRLAADINKPAKDIIDGARIASLCRQYREWLVNLPAGRLTAAGRLTREMIENERLSRIAGASRHLDDGSGHRLPLPSPVVGLDGDAWTRRTAKPANTQRVNNSTGDSVDTPPCPGDIDPYRLPVVKHGPGGSYTTEWKPDPSARSAGWLGRLLDIVG